MKELKDKKNINYKTKNINYKCNYEISWKWYELNEQCNILKNMLLMQSLKICYWFIFKKYFIDVLFKNMLLIYSLKICC